MIFVTGGTGLIGAHLLVGLTKQGHQVRCLRRESSDLEEVQKVFAYEKALDRWNQIEWVIGDIQDVPLLETLMENVDQVYHCAALVSYQSADRDRLMDINIQGTANVVNMALDKGVQRFCHVSSVAALGHEKTGPTTEKTPFTFTKKRSYYAISKHLGEREVWRGQEEGLQVVVVNPSVVIGPGFWTRSSGIIFNELKKGLPFYTKGTSGFVDVHDVVAAMTALMDGGHFGQRYILNSENIDLKSFSDQVADALGAKRPKIKVTKLMGAIAWRVEKVLAFLKGTQPAITKESISAARGKNHYDNRKIRAAIDFEFNPVKTTIIATAKAIMNW